MNANIRHETVPWAFKLPNGKVLFRIVQAKLTHERFDGGTTRELTRINFDRGDGVSVVVYSEATDEVVLVEQFRYPVYAASAQGDRDDDGWLLELVAGMKDDEGRTVAEREVQEETGCELTEPPERLATFYLSPGGTSERMEIYLAKVRDLDRVQTHAGVQHEGEDIRTHVVSLSNALKMIADGRIRDAKTIIGLMMLRDRLET